jgi:hypothetical protein
MKAFGRLLLATALIVPAGLVTAQSAGATPKPTATCDTHTGTLKFSPGVRLTRPVGQTISSTNGTLDGCSGIGIAGETGGVFNFSVNRSAVTCSSIRGKEFVGTGKLTWSEDGSNADIITNIKLRLTFTSYKTVSLKGKVTGSYSLSPSGARVGNGYLLNEPFSGKITVPDTLKPVGVGGGACQNKARVKSLAFENDGPTKL